MTLDQEASAIVRLVRRARLTLANEKAAQTDLSELLKAEGIDHEREVRLAPGDIPDFMLPSGLAIEMKMHGASKPAVYRQLLRYAKHDRVTGLILVTNLSMGLYEEINGKPVWVASAGMGWL